MKRRKASMMSSGSTLSIHPLRQTSFPPDGSDAFSPEDVRSPSVDTMSLVSGSIAGAPVKKKRGRKPKNAEDTASLAGGVGATAPRAARSHSAGNLEEPGASMIFTVTWKPTADDELADLWLKGPDRAAITAAANAIDALLRVDPHLQGESRADGTRVLFQPPLGVRFEVNEQDRVVEVLKVWRFRRKP